jgi:hypothetical protein
MHTYSHIFKIDGWKDRTIEQIEFRKKGACWGPCPACPLLERELGRRGGGGESAREATERGDGETNEPLYALRAFEALNHKLGYEALNPRGVRVAAKELLLPST